MTKHSPQYWIEILETDSHQGIMEMYQQFLPGIVKMVTSNNGTQDEAMDVFQEALLVIYKKIREGNFKLQANFFTYLFAVSRNIWLKKLEKKGRMRVTFLDTQELTDVDEFSEIILEEERYRLFRQKFNTLTDNCRQLLSLFFKKTPMTKIVEVMGFSSVQYAKKRKFQCKENLVKMIKGDINFKSLQQWNNS